MAANSSETFELPLSTRQAVIEANALAKAIKDAEKAVVAATAKIREHEAGIKALNDAELAAAHAARDKAGIIQQLIDRRKVVITTINAEAEAHSRLAAAQVRESDRIRERLAFQAKPSGLQLMQEPNVPERGVEAIRVIQQQNALLEEQARIRERLAFQMRPSGLKPLEEPDRDGQGMAYLRQRKAEIDLMDEKYAKLSAEERQLGLINMKYREAMVAIEANLQKQRQVMDTQGLTTEQKERHIAVLNQEHAALRRAADDYERQGAAAFRSMSRQRVAIQQATYALQDFVSAGGFSGGEGALARGFRGAANNLEVLAMSMSASMTPMKALGVVAIPTVALALLDMWSKSKKATSATEEHGEAMTRYAESVRKAREEVEALSKTEQQRELDKKGKDAAALVQEGNRQLREVLLEQQRINTLHAINYQGKPGFWSNLLPVLGYAAEYRGRQVLSAFGMADSPDEKWGRLKIRERIARAQLDEAQQANREIMADAEAKAAMQTVGGEEELVRQAALRIEARDAAGAEADLAMMPPTVRQRIMAKARDEAARRTQARKLRAAHPANRFQQRIEELEEQKQAIAGEKMGASRRARLNREIDAELNALRLEQAKARRQLEEDPAGMLGELVKLNQQTLEVLDKRLPPQIVPARQPNVPGGAN